MLRTYGHDITTLAATSSRDGGFWLTVTHDMGAIVIDYGEKISVRNVDNRAQLRPT